MNPKKLSLHRETLRNLDPHALMQARGAVSAPGGSQYECSLVCSIVGCHPSYTGTGGGSAGQTACCVDSYPNTCQTSGFATCN